MIWTFHLVQKCSIDTEEWTDAPADSTRRLAETLDNQHVSVPRTKLLVVPPPPEKKGKKNETQIRLVFAARRRLAGATSTQGKTQHTPTGKFCYAATKNFINRTRFGGCFAAVLKSTRNGWNFKNLRIWILVSVASCKDHAGCRTRHGTRDLPSNLIYQFYNLSARLEVFGIVFACIVASATEQNNTIMFFTCNWPVQHSSQRRPGRCFRNSPRKLIKLIDYSASKSPRRKRCSLS